MNISAFKPKTRLTLISFNGIAMSVKTEIQVGEDYHETNTFKERGKRKMFKLRIDTSDLVFEGWDLPIKLDTETNICRGNACYNFVTNEPEKLKEFINTKNLNDEFKNHAHILWIDKNDVENLLFPELETGHAVIQKLKSKSNASLLS